MPRSPSSSKNSDEAPDVGDDDHTKAGLSTAPSSNRGTARAVVTTRILCISGPNLQLLGTREPEVYGRDTLADIHARLAARGRALGVDVDGRQTNHEGQIVDWIGDAPGSGFSGLLLNPGAYTHTSIAVLDALRSVALPSVEVHLSNPDAREPFRRRSYVARACVGRVAGFGADSYELALEGLVRLLARGQGPGGAAPSVA